MAVRCQKCQNARFNRAAKVRSPPMRMRRRAMAQATLAPPVMAATVSSARARPRIQSTVRARRPIHGAARAWAAATSASASATSVTSTRRAAPRSTRQAPSATVNVQSPPDEEPRRSVPVGVAQLAIYPEDCVQLGAELSHETRDRYRAAALHLPRVAGESVEFPRSIRIPPERAAEDLAKVDRHGARHMGQDVARAPAEVRRRALPFVGRQTGEGTIEPVVEPVCAQMATVTRIP